MTQGQKDPIKIPPEMGGANDFMAGLWVLYSHFSGWWCGTCFICPYLGNVQNVIIPADELIFFRGVAKNHQPALVHMAMDQYLLIAFLGGWTSIYKLFWGSPGVQGFGTLPYEILVILLVLSCFGDGMKIPGRWLLPLFDGWSGLPHKTNLTFLHKSNVNGSENHGKAMTRILFVESMMMMIKKPLVLMVVCGVMILPYTSVDCWVSGCLSVLPAFRGLRKQLLSIAVLIVFMEDPVGEEWSVRVTDWDADPNLAIPKLLEDLEAKKLTWLVVTGTMEFYDFPYMGNNTPNWLRYFSEGWLNHQPVTIAYPNFGCVPHILRRTSQSYSMMKLPKKSEHILFFWCWLLQSSTRCLRRRWRRSKVIESNCLAKAQRSSKFYWIFSSPEPVGCRRFRMRTWAFYHVGQMNIAWRVCIQNALTS